MPETGTGEVETSAMPPAQAAPWGRYAAVMAGLGAASVFVINRWADIEPILESPAMIILSMLGVFGLGGLSSYWLLARPLEQRFGRAEEVIRRLRDRERELLIQIGELGREVAALSTAVEFLKERMDRAADPAPRRRKPSEPPKDS